MTTPKHVHFGDATRQAALFETMMLAAMADGHRVRTVEGMATPGRLDPVQEGFARCHGLQCGFCTPGMMLTARWLRLGPAEGRLFRLGTGTLCTLGAEHGEPVITSWNLPPC